ncbi:MAG: WD40 repeat domain-containing serine/threonine protein kinase [Planctomycetota bacterium]
MDLEALQIRGELGRGAMGAVYRAYDPASGREVALKVLLGGSLERLRREGEATASLHHPGIVRVYGAGVRGGRPCLVYELIEGARPLDDALFGGDLRGAVALLRDLGRALGHAHARGIVHRDVKPDNVLVDVAGRVRVADFGLAASADLERLTRTGDVVGTPYYMSPEMLTGAREQTGPPADVWALGILLYQVLADELPFPGDSLTALTVQVISAPPAPIPPERSAPPALLAVCRRALAKSPAERYPDGEAFAEELEAWLGGRPVQAELQARRRRGGRLLLGAAGAALALALGALAWSLTRAETAPAPGAGAAASLASEVAAASPSAPPDPARAWEEARRIDDPRERYLAARCWLDAYPTHALAREARLQLSRLTQRPLLRVELAGEREAARVGATFGPGEVVLATSRDPGALGCWDMRGQPRFSRRDGEGVIGVLALPRGGVLWWSRGTRLYIWRGAEPPRPSERELGLQAKTIRYAAAAPDGASFAIGLSSHVRVVRLPDFQVGRKIPVHGSVHALCFSPDGARLAIGAGDSESSSVLPTESQVVVVDPARGRRLGSYRLQVGLPIALAFQPAGEELLVGSSAGDIVRLDPAARPRGSYPPTESDRPDKRTLREGVKVLLFEAAGRWLYALGKGEERSFSVFDPRSGRRVRAVPLPEDSECLHASADGRLLLRGTRAATWELWGDPACCLDP